MKKEFIIFHQAWYYKANDPTQTKRELSIQICKNEFTIEWVALDRAPRVKMFDDAFESFVECPELFVALAGLSGQNAPIERFVEMLTGLGFKDATAYERP